ncbi:hypothetical protein [uncultured Akkermansia sp.]|uniref:hypothetical protein n=1 Tax=uncultured Akkermansia sp. TaxID=512294 RepID=UPI0025FD925C|nr:hypothetical protein [uncultured Akkermansia sp.]
MKQPTTTQERIEFNNKYGPAAPMAAGMLPPYGKSGYINPADYLRYSRDKATNPMYNGKPFGGINEINKVRNSDGYLAPLSSANLPIDNDANYGNALFTMHGSQTLALGVPGKYTFNVGSLIRNYDDIKQRDSVSPQDREINGYSVQRMGPKGIEEVNKITPDQYATGDHELRHALNQYTDKGQAKVEEQAKKHNLSIPNVYFGYEPGEVAPNLARLKDYGRYQGIDVDAPDGMQKTFEAFKNAPFDPEKSKEIQRFRNQLESYTKQLKVEGSIPKDDKETISPQAIKNWQTLYGHYWPGVARNQQVRPPYAAPTQTPPAQPAPQPVPPTPALAKQAGIASTLNASYNRLMNPDRMMKIAAILQKATDDLKSSDRLAGKRVQPPRVMSTPASGDFAGRVGEMDGDCQAKQASRKAMSAAFPH